MWEEGLLPFNEIISANRNCGSMISYYAKSEGKLTELSELQDGCWINISPPFSQTELEETAQQFDFPLDFLTDPLDIDERSRYEREEDARLMIVNTPMQNENMSESTAVFVTVPIGIILTDEHLITISPYENPVIMRFLEGKVKNFSPQNRELFVLQIFEQTVLRFLTCLKLLNAKRNLIEKELYDSSRSKELKSLLSIEKSLVYFVNSLSANELLKLKIKRTNFLKISHDEELTDLFEDIIIDNSQASEMSKIHTEILNGTMDSYSSIISNNLNIVIQRLTLITIILMVPTLVASFYGMNVSLPFQDKNYAFGFVLLLAVVISLLVAWYFQRKRMF